MSESLFASKEAGPGSLTEDSEVNVDSVKSKFAKEDGTLDVDALLIKAAHADKHISKIESENATLRSEVDKRINYQDLLDKITSTRQAASNPDDTSQGQRDGNPGGVTEADIVKKIDERFNQRQAEALRKANEVQVVKELVKTWGQDYVSKLKARVYELDMTEEEAILLSQSKPKAFLELIVPKETTHTQVDSSYVPPRTQQSTPLSGSGGTKNYNYFREQLRKNPRLEHDKRFVNEMHDMASKLGESFYN